MTIYLQNRLFEPRLDSTGECIALTDRVTGEMATPDIYASLGTSAEYDLWSDLAEAEADAAREMRFSLQLEDIR